MTQANHNTIIGTIVEAGIDQSGQVRLIIHTEAADLMNLTELPLYQPVLIRIEKALKPKDKAA